MLYATSKDRFRRELEGIHYEIQATDPTEVELEVLKERAYWLKLPTMKQPFIMFLYNRVLQGSIYLTMT